MSSLRDYIMIVSTISVSALYGDYHFCGSWDTIMSSLRDCIMIVSTISVSALYGDYHFCSSWDTIMSSLRDYIMIVSKISDSAFYGDYDFLKLFGKLGLVVFHTNNLAITANHNPEGMVVHYMYPY